MLDKHPTTLDSLSQFIYYYVKSLRRETALTASTQYTLRSAIRLRED